MASIDTIFDIQTVSTGPNEWDVTFVIPGQIYGRTESAKTVTLHLTGSQREVITLTRQIIMHEMGT